MIHKKLFTVAALVALVAMVTTAAAAPVFYLSNQPLGTATPGIPNLTNQSANTAGQLHLYVNPDVRVYGISLDITQTGNAIKFTGANVQNPSGRWAFLDGPLTVSDNQITSMGGAAIPGLLGNGVGPGSPEAPNATSGYLIATIDYMTLGTAGATSDLFLRIGANTVADANGSIPTILGPGSPETPGVAGMTDTMFDARISIQGGVVNTPPTLVPIVRNHSLLTDPAIVDLQLTATDAQQAVGDLVWSNLVYAGGPGKNFGGAADATMDADGLFDWNPAGWRQGAHTFNATVSDGAGGVTTGLALTVNLTVPEPATFAMLGLAMVGVVGVIRRRS